MEVCNNTDTVLHSAGLRYKVYTADAMAGGKGRNGSSPKELARQVRVFVRDGFIDRYSGEQLMYPGSLLLLRQLRPKFFQEMCAGTVSSGSYLKVDELTPQVDLMVPKHLGGFDDDENNWITTSVRRAAARGSRPSYELGWAVHPQGNMHVWDGLMSWFIQMMESNKEPGFNPDDTDLQKWYRVARSGVWVD